MTKPQLLDLYCGAGGASEGYARAGWEVVGVDLAPQPRYPFTFVQADAIDFLGDLLQSGGWRRFDAIHASPPCQRYSTLAAQHGPANVDRHPDLVAPTRDLLKAIGLPYVMENVMGAPLEAPLMLCGSMFGLGVEVHGEWRYLRRHRGFESSAFLWPPAVCAHVGRAIGVYGNAGGSSVRDAIWMGSIADRRTAMGVDWMGGDELSESIPPAYTEWIGRQLVGAL